MSDTYLSDNAGNRVPPGVASGAPKLGSGITLTDAATGGNHTQALTAGKSYKVMTDAVGGFLFGIADVTTAANVLWFLPPNAVMVFTMPLEYATLNYEGLVNGSTAYLVELE